MLNVPSPRDPISGEAGIVTRSWWRYLQALTGAVTRNADGSLSLGLKSAANDTAAAAAGVPVGALYQNAGAVRVRLT